MYWALSSKNVAFSFLDNVEYISQFTRSTTAIYDARMQSMSVITGSAGVSRFRQFSGSCSHYSTANAVTDKSVHL
jgi:hypothetical protein